MYPNVYGLSCSYLDFAILLFSFFLFLSPNCALVALKQMQDTKFYQDKSNGAAFAVECKKNAYGPCARTLVRDSFNCY